MILSMAPFCRCCFFFSLFILFFFFSIIFAFFVILVALVLLYSSIASSAFHFGVDIICTMLVYQLVIWAQFQARFCFDFTKIDLACNKKRKKKNKTTKDTSIRFACNLFIFAAHTLWPIWSRRDVRFVRINGYIYFAYSPNFVKWCSTMDVIVYFLTVG